LVECDITFSTVEERIQLLGRREGGGRGKKKGDKRAGTLFFISQPSNRRMNEGKGNPYAIKRGNHLVALSAVPSGQRRRRRGEKKLGKRRFRQEGEKKGKKPIKRGVGSFTIAAKERQNSERFKVQKGKGGGNYGRFTSGPPKPAGEGGKGVS